MSQSLTASGDGPGAPVPTVAGGVPSVGRGLIGDTGGTPVLPSRRYGLRKKHGADVTAPATMKESTRKKLQRYFRLKDKASECYEEMRAIQAELTAKKLIVAGVYYHFPDAKALLVGGKPNRCLTLRNNFAQASASRAVVIPQYEFKVWVQQPKTEPGLVPED